MRKFLGFFIVSCLVLWRLSDVVHAQSITDSKQQNREFYLQTLQDYRQKQSIFETNTEQYLQLKTLASLEEMVSAYKAVQLARIYTLDTYFVTLYASISEAKGFDLKVRDAQLAKIQKVRENLADRRQAIENANDIVQLDVTAKQDNASENALKQVAYEALANWDIARMDAGLDQLGLSAQTVYDYVQAQNLPATTAAEKQRAYDELVRVIQSSKDQLTEAKRLHQKQVDGTYSAFSYENVKEQLKEVYSGLQKGESFVKELTE